jgi:hypothetical protein
MNELVVFIPLVITMGHCIISACMFRKISNRITSLEEKIKPLFYPPPPPVYQVPSQVISIPQGYGYVYSGGQGNLNAI